MRMDPAVKEKWIEALRSGDYEQGKGALSIAGTYCCLGVLCDLAVKDGVSIIVSEEESALGKGKVFYDGRADLPPKSVADWAFPGHDRDKWTVDGLWHIDMDHHLPHLNDAQNWSFEQIADLVEQKL
jgi:hypothetical protein